jgi:hypothetical protein
VNFTAITLCVASPRVFIVARVTCDLRFSAISEMTDFKEQGICVKFCFKLGKTASETNEMLRQLSVTMPLREHKLLNGSLDSRVGKLRSKILRVLVVPRHVAQTKAWRMFAKSSTKTDETPLR